MHDGDDSATRDDTVPSVAAEPGTLAITRLVPASERYVIGEQIARGGMGEIYAAHDRLIGRDVAIKRLRGEAPQSALDRFFREASIQGRLEHPAIVPVHDLGIEPDGTPFFVMKKLSGTTLGKIIKTDPAFSRQRLLRAFVDVCYAVELAHASGILHRDLKPDNIVLGDFGEVYVLDWGIAKIAGAIDPTNPTPPVGDDVTRDGLTVGTPGYMSPEQARGDRDLDARADVFALGCMLFEMLAGDRLIPRTLDAAEIVDARPSIRAPQRDVAPELDVICVRATMRSRDDRVTSARELAGLVERFLDGDRDIELRKRLAREHLAGAQTAFSASDVTDSHRTAMRLAGRALALDPTLVPAAELVGRLMLEPPRDIPSEVVQSLADERARVQRRVARIGMFAQGGYVAVFAMLAVIGFSKPIYPILFSILIVLNIGVLAWYERSPVVRHPLPLMLASFALVGIIARMFSPFFIAPGVAAVTAMAFMLGIMPLSRLGIISTIAINGFAVLAPWIGEELGVFSQSFELRPEAIHVLSPGMQGTATAPVLSFAIYTLVLVMAAVLMAASLRHTEAEARRKLHLQAWQLRQLVPIKMTA